jgi:hypothetical protein
MRVHATATLALGPPFAHLTVEALTRLTNLPLDWKHRERNSVVLLDARARRDGRAIEDTGLENLLPLILSGPLKPSHAGQFAFFRGQHLRE